MIYSIFDAVVNFAGDGKAIEWAKGMVWGEVETSEVKKLPAHSKLICSDVGGRGVDVYYDFAADYYFFIESQEVNK